MPRDESGWANVSSRALDKFARMSVAGSACVSRWIAERRVAKSVDTNGEIGKQTLRSLLGDQPLIIEVGAHIGLDTEEFALAFPRGTVIAFEPHPRLHSQLTDRTRFYPNVTCFGVALSDGPSVRRFHQSSGSSDASGSILTPTRHLSRHPSVTFLAQDQTVVVTTTLDAYVEAAGIDKISLLWIDVQGAELLVLKGSLKSLAHIDWIYVEVAPTPLYEGGATYSDVQRHLERFGFKVFKEYLPAEWCGEGNVLFHRSGPDLN